MEGGGTFILVANYYFFICFDMVLVFVDCRWSKGNFDSEGLVVVFFGCWTVIICCLLLRSYQYFCLSKTCICCIFVLYE